MIRYKKKKSNRSFFITVILLSFLIFFSYRNPGTAQLPSSILNTILSPVNHVFYTIADAIQATYDSAFGSKATQEKVEQLTIENHALKEEINRLEMVTQNQPFLQDEYNILTFSPQQYIKANVTAMDGSNTFTRFTINAGSREGIAEGDIVVQGVKNSSNVAVTGLVGIITETGWNYSKVTSILNQSNNVSVLFQNANAYGIINSRDEELFFGYTIDAKAPIEIGDDVLSSGLGGVYPRGILVGQVADIHISDDELTKNFTVSSPVDFSKLYRVLVMKNPLEKQEENGDE